MLTLFVRLRLACWSSAVTAAPYLFSSEVIQNRWFKTSPRKMWKAYCGGFKTRVATWTKDDMTGPAIRLGRAVSAAFCVQTHFINAISRSFKLGANWNKNVSMTSILLDNKWIVMGTKDGDVVLYVVCVNTHIEEQQLILIHTHTHSGTITTTTNEPHWSHQNMRKTKALQL